MKKTFTQFALIGAMSVGNVLPALAYDNHSTQDVMKQEINQIHQTQEQAQKKIAQVQLQMVQQIRNKVEQMFKLQILTQPAQITVSVFPSQNTLRSIASPNDKTHALTDTNAQENFGDNNMQRIAGECKIKLSYSDEGAIVPLSKDDGQLLNLTALKNERQKQMAQEFILLHEYFHCEFTDVNNPIRVPGKNAQFNETLNYALKDIYNSVPMQTVSYMDTLNENFADVAAASTMYMEYGNNADFAYVIDAIRTQRHAAYFQNTYDTHMSHFSLNALFTQENLEKLSQIAQAISNKPDLIHAKQLRDLALDVANQGTMQMTANNINMREMMLNDRTMISSFIIGAQSALRYAQMDQTVRKPTDAPNMMSKNVSRGLTYQVSQEVAQALKSKAVYFTSKGNIGADNSEMFNDIGVVLSTQLNDKTKNDFLAARKTVQEFKDYTMKYSQIVDYDKVITKGALSADTVALKIQGLRNAFSERSASMNLAKNKI